MKYLKNQRGQAIVEFAVVLPLLLLLLMGIIQFGLVLNSYLTIQSVSREGARAGIVGNSNEEIKNLIIATTPNLEEDKLTIIITPSNGSRVSGDTLTVKLIYDYQLSIPIISRIFNDEIVLNAQTSMRIE